MEAYYFHNLFNIPLFQIEDIFYSNNSDFKMITSSITIRTQGFFKNTKSAYKICRCCYNDLSRLYCISSGFKYFNKIYNLSL